MTSVPHTRSYRLLDVLGQGGFGTVYRAEHLGESGFSKIVAVKLLNAASQNADQVQRLRDEARMLGLLQHPGIVAVDDLVQLDGEWAIVMEYVRGVSAAQAFELTGKLPLRVVTEIVAAVADALDAAYEARDLSGNPLKLLHRDIKPSNIQLTGRGGVKLLDFGVARAELKGREASTQRVVYGSVSYMAPERLELRDLHESDVYALAMTAISLLGGSLPQAPLATRSSHEKMLTGQEELLTNAAGLGVLLGDMLAYEPTERPSARQVRQRARDLRLKVPPPELSDWSREKLEPRIDKVGVPTSARVGQILTAGTSPNLQALASTASSTFDGFTTPSPADAREEAEPKKAKRSAGSMVGTVLGILAAMAGFTGLSGVLIVFAILGMIFLGCAGLVAIVWPSALTEVCVDHMQERRAELREVNPGPNTRRMKVVLERASDACYRFSFMESFNFDQRATLILKDRRVTEGEVKQLEGMLNDILSR